MVMRRVAKPARATYSLIALKKPLVVCAWLAVFALLAIGCTSTTADVAPIVPDADVATVRPTETSLATPAATPSASPTTPPLRETTIAPTPVSLTIWLPAEMTAAAGGGAAVEAIAALDAEFAAAYPEVKIDVVPKAQYGSGGMVDMLLATQAVVPDRLPDLVVVDVSEIAQLLDADLLVPLEEIAESADVSLPPAIAEAVSRSEHRFAVPFQADVQILAYNAVRMDVAPLDWAEMLSAGHSLALPLRDGDGAAADAFWLQYVARGGTYDGAPPELDTALMASILQAYLDAATAGVISADALEMSSAQESWSWYVEGKADMCVVESSRYLADQRAAAFSSFAPVPTQAGTAATMARSWAWAITTAEPGSAALAGAYIDHALGSEYLAQWLVAGRYLPLGMSSGGTLIRNTYGQEYLDFGNQLLDKAFVYPDMRYYPAMQTIIGQMIAGVLASDETPERAAVSAAAAINSLR